MKRIAFAAALVVACPAGAVCISEKIADHNRDNPDQPISFGAVRDNAGFRAEKIWQLATGSVVNFCGRIQESDDLTWHFVTFDGGPGQGWISEKILDSYSPSHTSAASIGASTSSNAEADKLKTDLESMTAGREAALSELTKARSDRDAAQSELALIKSQLASASATAKTIEDVKSFAAEQVASARAERDAARSELSRVKAQLTAAQAERDDWKMRMPNDSVIPAPQLAPASIVIERESHENRFLESLAAMVVFAVLSSAAMFIRSLWLKHAERLAEQNQARSREPSAPQS